LQPELIQPLMRELLFNDQPQSVLTKLAKALGQGFPSDNVALVYAAPEQPARVIYWQAPNHDYSKQHRLICPTGILNHPAIATLFANSNVLAIPDLTVPADHHWLSDTTIEWLNSLQPGLKPSPEAILYRAILAVVTRLNHDVNGMIAILRSQPYQWMEADVQLLNTLAEPLAIAMSNAHFRQQVRQQQHYQALIGQIIAAIRNTVELDHIFELALTGVVNALNVSRASILLLKYADPIAQRLNPDPSRVRVSVARQWPAMCDLNYRDEHSHQHQPQSLPNTTDHWNGTWLHCSFALEDCCCCHHLFMHPQDSITVPRMNQTTVGRDAIAPGMTFQDFSCLPSIDQSDPVALPLQLNTMPGLALLPLESQNKVLGYLAVQHYEPCAWQPEEVTFLKLVAAQVSSAIIQSHTLQQVQSLVDERTAQLKHSLDVQAKLYNKTRQQIDQLQQLNQLKDEFLSTMSHELRTPLTSMKLAIRMLRQSDLSEERRSKYLDILEEQCAQETSLINDLLALQKIETGGASTHLQTLDIRWAVQNTIQAIASTFAESNLVLSVDLPDHELNIRTDAESLDRVLQELLTNARKYAATQTTVSVRVAAERSPNGTNHVQIAITNYGKGIDNEDMPHIFDKFRRGKGITQQAIPGTGLGLALVKGLAVHLNGSITLVSQPVKHHPHPPDTHQAHPTQNGPSQQWETQAILTLPQ
jgi:signal transduction histidine kinase